MQQEVLLETVEVPGVGEVRGKPGTSTIELAGAASYWYKRWKTAHIDGVIAGVALTVFSELLLGAAYYLIRNI